MSIALLQRRNNDLLLIFSGGSPGKESACNAGNLGLIPELERPLEKGTVPTPVFWPGEFHGLYSTWGRKESDKTEQLSLTLILSGEGNVT